MTDTVLPAAVHTTWPRRIDEPAAAHPHATALSTTAGGGESLTWRQPAELGLAAAARLADLGVRAGSSSSDRSGS